ncbi:MAG TPA: DNA polymerase III subunit beta [Thermomicrobiales bacterium]|nr:DNA polymerase III subunit beta [Thermomicrobiales bacterium]
MAVVQELLFAVEIDRAAFERALQIVGPAVARAPTAPILAAIQLAAADDALTLTATDLELAIVTRAAARVGTPGTVAVPARLLRDCVGALPAGPVALGRRDAARRLTLTGARAAATIALLDEADFPAIVPGDAAPLTLTLDAHALRRALQRVLPAVEPHAAVPDRAALGAVCLGVGAGGLRLAATDGRRAAQTTLRGVAAPAERQLLVPRRAAVEFVRLLAAGGAARLAFTPAGNSLRLTLGATTVFARLIAGVFPDLAGAVPRRLATRVAVERAGLLHALRLAAPFSAGEDDRAVVLDAAEGHLRLANIAAEAGTGETDLPAALEGRAGTIALDLTYLAKFLETATAPVVTLGWESPLGALVLREGGAQADADGRWLIGPVYNAALAREWELATAPARADVPETRNSAGAAR